MLHRRTISQASWPLVGALVLVAGCKIEASTEVKPDDRTPFVLPAAPPPFIPADPPAQTKRLVILHTNDEHSHLLGFAPNSVYPYIPRFSNNQFDPTATAVAVATQLATAPDAQTAGGIVRRQYLINKERAAAASRGDPVLLLSGGDVMMGTVFHAAYASGQAPDYLAMAILGYDFTTLGNHEFDFGADILGRAIGSVHQTTFGGGVPVIASNIHFDDVEANGTGSALQDLMGEGNSGAPMMPWATKTMANGLKVGFLGLVGYDAALVAPFKTPIYFSTPRTGNACDMANPCVGLESCVGGRCVNPLDVMGHVGAMAAETQAMIDILKNRENVDVVVAMTHLGQDEDNALAMLTNGLDVIIGGHSHEVLEAYKVGDTIVTQAGAYGRLLGRLILTVAPNGAVDFVDSESELLPTDFTVDTAIYGDTDLMTGKVSTTLTTALTLTGGVIAPIMQGLDAALAPALGLTSLLDVVIRSDHDVVGERAFEDSYLMHMVTDATRVSYISQTCHLEAGGPPVISFQANGVVRESLRFGPTGSSSAGATFADVFRVLPLGASPFEGAAAAPGYPVTVFTINALELLAGADVGVTVGLDADNFFLSYSGARVSYDRNRPPFDPTAMNPLATGRVTKIELDNGMRGYWTLYDTNAAGGPAMAFTGPTGQPVDPSTFYVTIVSNLYLAGFLERFGITPRMIDGTPMPGEGTARLAQMSMCYTGMQKNCAMQQVGMFNCILGGGPPWPAAPEVKEWQLLTGYLTRGLNGRIPTQLYNGATVAPADLRVIDVTQ